MIRSLIPELITLEGEQYDNHDMAELLGIDDDDTYYIGKCLSADEERYLNLKYPELIGAWGILAKVGKAVLKGGKAIGKGIGKAAKRRTAKSKAAISSTITGLVEKAKAKQGIVPQKVATQADTLQKVIPQVGLKKMTSVIQDVPQRTSVDMQSQQQKMIMMIGIPAIALLVAMMLMKK